MSARVVGWVSRLRYSKQQQQPVPATAAVLLYIHGGWLDEWVGRWVLGCVDECVGGWVGRSVGGWLGVAQLLLRRCALVLQRTLGYFARFGTAVLQ